MSLKTILNALGDAVRSLSGGTNALTLEQMIAALNAITRKSAATYTPGTADQTIAAGQYLSGAQTIKGDANLLAENIAEGVSIFDVAGLLKASAKYASGTAKNVNMTTKYTDSQYGSGYISYVEVTGLDFQPSAIILTKSSLATQGIVPIDSGGMIVNPDTHACEIIKLVHSTDADEHRHARAYVSANYVENGFRIPIRSNSSIWTYTYTYYWFAIGA